MSERGPTLTPLRRVSARLDAHDWAWARDHEEAIAHNWRRRCEERPGLFDGPVLLCHGFAVRDGVGEARFFETGYARFLAFRDAGSPDPEVFNAFAAIVPHTADGAVLLGRMAPHTANAGQIYFPCGTPDREDVRADGRVDLDASAARELAEETGLSLPETGGDAWVLVRGDGQLAFLKPVRFAGKSDDLVARCEAHRRGQAEPELSGLVVARGRAAIDPAAMPGFVRAYLDSVFTDSPA